jgi:hypothetical protein
MELVFLFSSPYDQYQEYNGETCKIINVFAEPDERHDEEALPMFEVVFEDGTKIEAYPEELVPYKEDK